jgi:hypothetical protein
MPEKKLIDGVIIKLGGEQFTVPPMNLKTVRRLLPAFDQLKSGSLDGAALDAAIGVVHGALSRNYPDLTADEVAEMVDLSNLEGVLSAVLEVSGLAPKTTGAPKAETVPADAP